MAPPINMTSYGYPFQMGQFSPITEMYQLPEASQMHATKPEKTNSINHVNASITTKGSTNTTVVLDSIMQEACMLNHAGATGEQGSPQQERDLLETLTNVDPFDTKIEDSDFNDYNPNTHTFDNKIYYTNRFLAGCEIAEKVAKRNQHRPCLKNLHNVCYCTRCEITGPSLTLPNIHTQGVSWVTKDFISSYMRLIHSRQLIKGYLDVETGKMKNIEHEFTKEFRAFYSEWEDTSRELSEHMVRIFSNLDTNVSNNPASVPFYVNRNMERDDEGSVISEQDPHDCDERYGWEFNDHPIYEPAKDLRHDKKECDIPISNRTMSTGEGDVSAQYKTRDGQARYKDGKYWQAALAACSNIMNSKKAVKEEFNSGVDWHTWAHNEPNAPQGASASAGKMEENARFRKELEMHKQHLQHIFLQQHPPQQMPYMRQPCSLTTASFLENMRKYAQCSGQPTGPAGPTPQSTGPAGTSGPIPRSCSQHDSEVMKSLLAEIKKTEFYITLQKPAIAGKNMIPLIYCKEKIDTIFTKIYNSIGEMIYDLRRVIINAQYKFLKDSVITSQIEKFRAAIHI